jgi:hypothetical protein
MTVTDYPNAEAAWSDRADERAFTVGATIVASWAKIDAWLASVLWSNRTESILQTIAEDALFCSAFSYHLRNQSRAGKKSLSSFASELPTSGSWR